MKILHTGEEWEAFIRIAKFCYDFPAYISVIFIFPQLVESTLNIIHTDDEETKRKVLESASYVMWKALSADNITDHAEKEEDPK